MKRFALFTAILLAAGTLCMITGLVSGLALDVTARVAVTAVDPANGTLTVAATPWLGCNATDSTDRNLTGSVNCNQLTGTVPDTQMFSVIAPGDQVIVAGYGEQEGRFISVAKLVQNVSGSWLVTDIFGDPEQISVPLIGDYGVSILAIPDCASCQSNLCNVSSANVTILSSGDVVAKKTLSVQDPTLFFNGRNDASSVNVTFISAKAQPGLCTKAIAEISGVTPVRNYIIHVVPPLGSVNITAVATVPATVQTTDSPKTAVPTTAKSGVPVPAGAIAAAVLGMLVVALKKT